jgi:mono/diheme cytochrome c family protein
VSEEVSVYRIVTLILLAVVVVGVAILGVRGTLSERRPLVLFQDMVNQPRYDAQEESEFFADARAQRLPPTHTVPWGREAAASDERFARPDDELYGVTRIPVPVTAALLVEGRRVYSTFCVACHGAAGDGAGITTEYGMISPPSYHQDRLREMADGRIFETITLGRWQMGPLADRIPPERRWAVIAYVRALQLSQRAPVEELSEQDLQLLGDR